jgi:hypothetical protein
MTDYATLLRDHVTLKVRSIDRIFLQDLRPQPADRRAGVPLPPLAAKLQDFLTLRPLAKSASNIPKPLIALPHNGRFPGCSSRRDGAREGLGLALLAAQRTGKRCSSPDLGRQMAYPNHFYFYLWDAEWGSTFWKTNAYAPFPIWFG